MLNFAIFQRNDLKFSINVQITSLPILASIGFGYMNANVVPQGPRLAQVGPPCLISTHLNVMSWIFQYKPTHLCWHWVWLTKCKCGPLGVSGAQVYQGVNGAPLPLLTEKPLLIDIGHLKAILKHCIHTGWLTTLDTSLSPRPFINMIWMPVWFYKGPGPG